MAPTSAKPLHRLTGPVVCVFLIFMTVASAQSFSGASWDNADMQPCTNSSVCGQGQCVALKCRCLSPYISVKLQGSSTWDVCSYQARKKLTTFLFSFFLGIVGVDWFTLARGNGCYICGGVGKILTCGAGGIWAIVDWIRVLTDSFPDGNNAPLFNNM